MTRVISAFTAPLCYEVAIDMRVASICLRIFMPVSGVVTYIIFLVDRFGRRKPLMGGALLMGILMLIVAIIIVTNPPNPKAGISSAGAAGIAMIYLEAFTFNFSWGPGKFRNCCVSTLNANTPPGPWLYIGEIFPNRIREIGIASGAASQVSRA